MDEETNSVFSSLAGEGAGNSSQRLHVEYKAKLTKFIVKYFLEPCNKTRKCLRCSKILDSFTLEEVAPNIEIHTAELYQKYFGYRADERLAVLVRLSVLVQYYVFTIQGIFISAVTLEKWVSSVFGSTVGFSRLWIGTEWSLRQLAAAERESILVVNYTAPLACMYAMKAQVGEGLLRTAAPLYVTPFYKLWARCANALANVFVQQKNTLQNICGLYIEAFEDSKRARNIILDRLIAPRVEDQRVLTLLYAAPEPELCACIVFVCLFRQLGSYFKSSVLNRECLEQSASVVRDFFYCTVNYFTMSQFCDCSGDRILPLLDAVTSVLSGDVNFSSLEKSCEKQTSRKYYADRAEILTLDSVSSGVQSLTGSSSNRKISEFPRLPSISHCNFYCVEKWYFYFQSLFQEDSKGCSVHDRSELWENGVRDEGNEFNCDAEDCSSYDSQNSVWSTYKLFEDSFNISEYFLSDSEREKKKILMQKLHGAVL